MHHNAFLEERSLICKFLVIRITWECDKYLITRLLQCIMIFHTFTIRKQNVSTLMRVINIFVHIGYVTTYAV